MQQNASGKNRNALESVTPDICVRMLHCLPTAQAKANLNYNRKVCAWCCSASDARTIPPRSKTRRPTWACSEMPLMCSEAPRACGLLLNAKPPRLVSAPPCSESSEASADATGVPEPAKASTLIFSNDQRKRVPLWGRPKGAPDFRQHLRRTRDTSLESDARPTPASRSFDLEQ